MNTRDNIVASIAFIIFGLFSAAIFIAHGAAFFVLSGNYKGETPFWIAFGYLLSAASIGAGVYFAIRSSHL